MIRRRKWKAKSVRLFIPREHYQGAVHRPYDGEQLCGHRHRDEDVALRCAQDEAKRRNT